MRFYFCDSAEEEMSIVWVDFKKLLELTEPQYRVESWTGDAKENWFMSSDKSRGLRLPYAGITSTANGYVVTVGNGRHRSAWLASLGHEEVPIAIPASQVKLGVQAGLVKREAICSDTIPNMQQYATPLAPPAPIDAKATVHAIMAKLRR